MNIQTTRTTPAFGGKFVVPTKHVLACTSGLAADIKLSELAKTLSKLNNYNSISTKNLEEGFPSFICSMYTGQKLLKENSEMLTEATEYLKRIKTNLPSVPTQAEIKKLDLLSQEEKAEKINQLTIKNNLRNNAIREAYRNIIDYIGGEKITVNYNI